MRLNGPATMSFPPHARMSVTVPSVGPVILTSHGSTTVPHCAPSNVASAGTRTEPFEVKAPVAMSFVPHVARWNTAPPMLSPGIEVKETPSQSPSVLPVAPGGLNVVTTFPFQSVIRCSEKARPVGVPTELHAVPFQLARPPLA